MIKYIFLIILLPVILFANIEGLIISNKYYLNIPKEIKIRATEFTLDMERYERNYFRIPIEIKDKNKTYKIKKAFYDEPPFLILIRFSNFNYVTQDFFSHFGLKHYNFTSYYQKYLFESRSKYPNYYTRGLFTTLKDKIISFFVDKDILFFKLDKMFKKKLFVNLIVRTKRKGDLLYPKGIKKYPSIVQYINNKEEIKSINIIMDFLPSEKFKLNSNHFQEKIKVKRQCKILNAQMDILNQVNFYKVKTFDENSFTLVKDTTLITDEYYTQQTRDLVVKLDCITNNGTLFSMLSHARVNFGSKFEDFVVNLFYTKIVFPEFRIHSYQERVGVNNKHEDIYEDRYDDACFKEEYTDELGVLKFRKNCGCKEGYTLKYGRRCVPTCEYLDCIDGYFCKKEEVDGDIITSCAYK